MFSPGTFTRRTSGSASSKVASSATVKSLHKHINSRREYNNYDKSWRGGKGREVQDRPNYKIADDVHNIFFQALSRASLCKQHARQYHNRAPIHGTTFFTPRQPSSIPPSRSSATSSLENQHNETTNVATGNTNPSREDLRSLVDIYQPFTENLGEPDVNHDHVLAQLPDTSDTYIDTKEEPWTEAQNQRQLREASEDDASTIARLVSLLQNEDASPDEVFKVYQDLPAPRMAYLHMDTIKSLKNRVRSVERKDRKSMLRFFTIMDDMAAAQIQPHQHDWNAAISYAGRWLKRIHAEQVETAMRMWIRMEREANLKGDSVTFNTLFDVAIRARKYALGEVILKEMEARNIEQTRFLRTSKIKYYGLKKDGEAVRRTYKELVDAGDIVDTFVLTSVITGLIDAGEASAAEQVFERMKQLHSDKPGREQMPRKWQQRRALANNLVGAARKYRDKPEERTKFQDASPIAPNTTTFIKLIKYHAWSAGNVDRVSELMQEMKQFDLKPHGYIYFLVFGGFSMHGGIRYSAWTRARLDRLWRLFLIQVEEHREINEKATELTSEEERGGYITYGIAMMVLKAYIKCTSKDDVSRVWEEILERWSPNDEELERINSMLADSIGSLSDDVYSED